MATKRPGIRKVFGKRYDNFELLQQHIRSVLGPDWTFYRECLEGILQAVAWGGDASAWLCQMTPLVEAWPNIETSHEGILFLLGEMLVDRRDKLPASASVRVVEGIQGAQYQVASKTSVAPLAHSSPPHSPHLHHLDNYVQHGEGSQAPRSKTVPSPMAPPLRPVQQQPTNMNDLLFYDEKLPSQIRDFFGVQQVQPATRNRPKSRTASLAISPYNPCDDDLMVWKQRLAGVSTSKPAKPITTTKPKIFKDDKDDEDRVSDMHDMANEGHASYLGRMKLVCVLSDEDYKKLAETQARKGRSMVGMQQHNTGV